MSFKFLPGLLPLLFILLLAQPAYSFDQSDPQALEAAELFLYHLDAGDFASAWSQTTSVNQSFPNPPEWFQLLMVVRPQLGQVLSRQPSAFSRHDSWVALPDGDYLRYSFTASFSNKRDGLETVILLREAGRWAVSVYKLR